MKDKKNKDQMENKETTNQQKHQQKLCKINNTQSILRAIQNMNQYNIVYFLRKASRKIKSMSALAQKQSAYYSPVVFNMFRSNSIDMF